MGPELDSKSWIDHNGATRDFHHLQEKGFDQKEHGEKECDLEIPPQRCNTISPKR